MLVSLSGGLILALKEISFRKGIACGEYQCLSAKWIGQRGHLIGLSNRWNSSSWNQVWLCAD
jgi:hypothetical protein